MEEKSWSDRARDTLINYICKTSAFTFWIKSWDEFRLPEQKECAIDALKRMHADLKVLRTFLETQEKIVRINYCALTGQEYDEE